MRPRRYCLPAATSSPMYEWVLPRSPRCHAAPSDAELTPIASMCSHAPLHMVFVRRPADFAPPAAFAAAAPLRLYRPAALAPTTPLLSHPPPRCFPTRRPLLSPPPPHSLPPSSRIRPCPMLRRCCFRTPPAARHPVSLAFTPVTPPLLHPPIPPLLHPPTPPHSQPLCRCSHPSPAVCIPTARPTPAALLLSHPVHCRIHPPCTAVFTPAAAAFVRRAAAASVCAPLLSHPPARRIWSHYSTAFALQHRCFRTLPAAVRTRRRFRTRGPATFARAPLCCCFARCTTPRLILCATARAGAGRPRCFRGHPRTTAMPVSAPAQCPPPMQTPSPAQCEHKCALRIFCPGR
ncbi:hypothetical protein B0H12DRAFT_1145031 [Mycena haematopus]|nr:hypothetical protein B0H12DRAFT_1145031 [Mycena haematopus]